MVLAAAARLQRVACMLLCLTNASQTRPSHCKRASGALFGRLQTVFQQRNDVFTAHVSVEVNKLVGHLFEIIEALFVGLWV